MHLYTKPGIRSSKKTIWVIFESAQNWPFLCKSSGQNGSKILDLFTDSGMQLYTKRPEYFEANKVHFGLTFEFVSDLTDDEDDDDELSPAILALNGDTEKVVEDILKAHEKLEKRKKSHSREIIKEETLAFGRVRN